MRLRFSAAALATLALGACMSLGPDYQRPSVETPVQWPGAGQDEAISATWWKAYNDPVLERLIDDALLHNLDLRRAIARVNEARAVLGIVRADQYPGVSASAGASRNRMSQEGALSPPGVQPEYSDHRATLNASYEVNFWGKFSRASEAARAEMLGSQFNREAVRLALIADIARNYFNLRALDAQLAITNRTISTRLASTALLRMRFEAGITSELELRQAEAEAAQARAFLPRISRQLAAQETALSVLIGRSPRALVEQPLERGAAIEALTTPPAVPAGLPSALLERRPDLRQAEQSLIAANAGIGLARAAYFPSISLSAFLGGESASLSSLFNAQARIWQLAGSATQTLFDAGRTGAQVEGAQARQQQVLAQYQAAIQNAFKDALDALVAQRTAREIAEAEQLRIDALQAALRLAQLRYDNGISSLLDVLISERALLDAQLNRVDAQRAQLSASADLFKALGGGWDGSVAGSTGDSEKD